ncbi:hypothetical protein HLPCO_001965 [Haloplasma contractile SSD-17B]|uniref:Uncharacterized protein n=1 Tax=Haloplasma contractile SSD-17B TaxID=1033810 RepID=U2EB88_9MOLU|nr:hypothetical protein HLPCO_001965 [Haloplasma contractile SSD-17B]
MQKLIIAIIILYTVYHTWKFGIRVWDEKNKIGSTAVILLAVGILLIPLFMNKIKPLMYPFVEWLQNLGQ